MGESRHADTNELDDLAFAASNRAWLRYKRLGDVAEIDFTGFIETWGKILASIVNLIKAYQRFIGLEWTPNLARPQKVLFAVYDPRTNAPACPPRRVRERHQSRRQSLDPVRPNTSVRRVDVERQVPRGLLRGSDDLEVALSDFEAYASGLVVNALEKADGDERSVVAVHGAASLFGFMKVCDSSSSSRTLSRGDSCCSSPGSTTMASTGSWTHETAGTTTPSPSANDAAHDPETITQRPPTVRARRKGLN